MKYTLNGKGCFASSQHIIKYNRYLRTWHILLVKWKSIQWPALKIRDIGFGPCHRLPNTIARIKSFVLQRDTCVRVRPRGIANRIIKEVSDQKGGPGSVVGIATGYALDGPEIESRWGRDFPHLSRRPWGPHSLLYNGYRVFPGGKNGRSVTLTTPFQCRGQERVELYLYCPLWAVRPVQSHSACARVHFSFFYFTDQKVVGPSSDLMSSHWSLKSRNSQYTYGEFRIIHTAFIYSSLALHPVRVKVTRTTAYWL